MNDEGEIMGLLDEQVPASELAITAAEPHAIADAVENLTAVAGITVPAIDVRGLRVTLRRHSDQRDGDWYVITGVTRTTR